MNLVLQIALLISIVGLVFQKSKLLTVLIFFFIWTLSHTTAQADYANYVIMYENDIAKDIGYYLVSKLFKSWEFDYLQFRLLFLGVGWLIYCWFILKYTERSSLVAVLYLWTTSFFDMVQNRNFFAFAICLIGIDLLIRNPSFRNRVIYVVIVMLASSFHITCCFFLSLVILDKRVLKRLSVFQLFLIATLAVVLFTSIYLSSFSYRIEGYDRGVSMLTKSLLILLFVFNFLFIRYATRYKTSDNAIAGFSHSKFLFAMGENKSVLLYNIGLFILLPAAFMSLSALRIYRYMGLIDLAYVSDRLISENMCKQLYLNVLILLYAVSFWLVTYLMHSTTYLDGVVLPVFYDNLFYK